MMNLVATPKVIYIVLLAKILLIFYIDIIVTVVVMRAILMWCK